MNDKQKLDFYQLFSIQSRNINEVAYERYKGAL